MESQRTLDFNRGEQLSLRRTIDLPSGEKFILWILDDHIGGSSSWAMSMKDLADESGYSIAGTYKFVAALKAKTLVDWDELPDGKRRFRICWQNVAELIELQAGCGGGVVPLHGTDVPPRGMTFHHVECDSTTWNDVPPDGMTFHHVECIYRNERPSNDQVTTTINAPPHEELVVMVASCKVGLAGDCVATAIERGMTPEAIRAVVEHYQANPGRWSAGVLFERLTRLGAYALPPHEGWYGDAAGWVATQQQQASTEAAAKANPEIRWGPVLDAMSRADVEALAERLEPRDRAWVRGRLPDRWQGSSVTVREVRRLLLMQLHRESTKKGNA